MKLNKKLSFLAFTALAAVTALTSCSDDKYWDENGIAGQGVTFDRKAMSAIYKPGEEIPTPVFNVVVRRGTTSGSETITVGGFTTDADGEYTVPLASDAPWSFPTTATFAEGSNQAIIPVTLTTTAEGTYRMGLKITSTSSLALGSNDVVTLTVSISAGDPQPIWRSLGIGKFTFKIPQDYEFPTASLPVEVQVDDAAWPEGSKGYYGHYRLVKPFGSIADIADELESIEFYICPPDTSFPFWDRLATNPSGFNFSWGKDETLTLALMKTFELHGWTYWGNQTNDFLCFNSPIYFKGFDTNKAMQESISVLEGWVLEPDYEKTPGTDEFRGIPNAVSLGFYMLDGHDMSGSAYTNQKSLYFIFPGGSLGDFTFDLSYFGHTFNADKTREYLDAEIKALGTDCKDFVIGLVQTKSTSDATDAVKAFWEERKKSDDPESLPLPEGMYGYNEATITEGNSQNFRYEVPQVSTNYTFVAFSINEGEIAQTATVGVKFQSIIDMGGEDANWDNLGMGQMTDDMLIEYYVESVVPDYVVAYDVPVQKHKTEAGMYRVVTPYSSEYYPFNLGKFESSDDNIIIDATNPQCVKIPTFSVGVLPFTPPAELFLCSASYYYAENGVADNTIIAAGLAGTLVNNVVSFPAANEEYGTSMLGMVPEATDELQPANAQGAFKVVLPGASKAARKVTAKSHKGHKNLTFKKSSLQRKAAKMISHQSKDGYVMSAKGSKKATFRVPMALPHQLR